MEVLVESPSRIGSNSTMDNFDLSSIMISPYLSAPSSPKRFGEYYSEFYQEFDYFSSSSSSSNIPFEAPTNNDDGDGFAFYVNRESNTSSRSAEELFDGGKIKPLKPEGNEMFTSDKKIQAFSAKKKKETRFGDNTLASETEQRGRERGRDRTPASMLSSSNNSGRRVTRSHSPYRISKYTLEEEQHHPQQQNQKQQPRSNKEDSTTSSSNSRTSSSKGSKRWRLSDLLLFRSVSEGRGTSKDSYKKFNGYKKPDQEVNGSRKKGPVSAHEFHYAMKKAESEDLKKRTFLPYKQGILGRLAGFGF